MELESNAERDSRYGGPVLSREMMLREARLLELRFQRVEESPLSDAKRERGAALRRAVLARHVFPDRLRALRSWIERGGMPLVAYRGAMRDLRELIEEAGGGVIVDRRECILGERE